MGYSSPEGSYAANARLSEQRAKALEQNLKHAYQLDDSMIDCRSVPENWEGLAAWLREYRPSYMQKVLDIIGQTPEPDARDAKIKAIDGGKSITPCCRRYIRSCAWWNIQSAIRWFRSPWSRDGK